MNFVCGPALRAFTSLRDMSLRRKLAARACQHLAKVYDAAHPRAQEGGLSAAPVIV